MKVFYLSGWVLAFFSFFSGGMEIVAMSKRAGYSIYLSAYDSWHTLWPASLVNTGVWFRKTPLDWLWDPLILAIMQLPGWLIFGVPAALLIIMFRPPRLDGEDEETDLISLLQSLSDRAREDETYNEGEDDLAPTHFIPDPEGFEPSDHKIASRQADFDSWDQVDWADSADEKYIHMRFEDEAKSERDEVEPKSEPDTDKP